MNYVIKWHPQAYKILMRLPKSIIKRVLDKLDEVVKDPFRFLEHFEGKELYKLRIGDYRALIKIDYEEKLLLVQVFDHRGRIYQR